MNNNPQNILIVDDTPANLDLLERILQDSGYEVRAMPNAQLALKSASHMPPDLILLDIKMPGIDGYQACAKLKELEATRDVPIIFISALQETDDKVRAFQSGGVDYVTKPFQADEVLARVRTHLELKRVREQLEQQNEELVVAAQLRDDVERITRHDLKGPLNSILPIPSLLGPYYDFSEEHFNLLKNVERSAYKMLDMINRSMDLYKMETGTYQAQIQPINMTPLLYASLREAAANRIARNKPWQITRLGNPLPEQEQIWADGEEMLCLSMFSNLLLNAFEAAPEGSEILVDLDDRDETQLKISITNTGAVPEEIRDHFFDKYVTHGKTKGTGLGTYSARLCALTQRGSIELETGDNQTRLIINLPRSQRTSIEDLKQLFGHINQKGKES
jgi:CheY-like chemotaxis protein